MVGTGTKRSLRLSWASVAKIERSDLSHFVFRHSARDIETGGRSINLGSHFGFLLGPIGHNENVNEVALEVNQNRMNFQIKKRAPVGAQELSFPT